MRTVFSTSICRIFLALSLVAALPGTGSAQEYSNTAVTVSKEKVRIGGKVCYSHIVLEKQTLYSISKAYGVSIEDIYRFNPSLAETGLKKNSIILIPSQEALQENARKDTEEVTDAGQEVVRTEVRKQEETPEQENSGQEVRKQEKKKEKKEEKKEQTIHVRKWYEDLDMIAEQYGVSVEAIMEANDLKGRKLSNRQKLIIPAKGEVIPQVQGTEEKAVEETAVTVQETEPEDTLTQSVAEQPEKEPYLFPQNHEVNATVLLPMKNSTGQLSRNNMDFYCGLMLAVYDMAQKGIDTDINVYDITDPESPVTREDIENSDMIIGPITTADLTRLFQTSPSSCPVISPLDPRAERLVASHSNMIQAPTPHKSQFEDLVNWIREDMKENDKVFMFSERVSRNNSTVATMKEVMDSSGIAYTPFTYSILEGRDIVQPLKELMTAEGTNRIYIASESEAFVNDVVRNLNLMLLENLDVVLYAPSKIRSFDTIEVEHFHKTSMHVSLTYYIDYEK